MKRNVIQTIQGQEAQDGAGVRLVRVLGYNTTEDFDPILMLDSFDSRDPRDFAAGFPTHPHRGIETITYMAEGEVKHQDSMGNTAIVANGEAQWLTAGSGVLHSEYMSATDRLLGVQLWLNLPRALKMVDPAYQSITRDQIPVVDIEGGQIRVITGSYGSHHSYQAPHLPLDYYDIRLDPHAQLILDIPQDRSVMVFTLLGSADVSGTSLPEKCAAKLSEGDQIEITAGPEGTALLMMSSLALHEPIAWHGPIVMNTMGEIKEAISELNDGTFIRVGTDYSHEK